MQGKKNLMQSVMLQSQTTIKSFSTPLPQTHTLPSHQQHLCPATNLSRLSLSLSADKLELAGVGRQSAEGPDEKRCVRPRAVRKLGQLAPCHTGQSSHCGFLIALIINEPVCFNTLQESHTAH